MAGGGSVLGGYRLMRYAWQQGHRPTGIFCATDERAVGALGALAREAARPIIVPVQIVEGSPLGPAPRG